MNRIFTTILVLSLGATLTTGIAHAQSIYPTGTTIWQPGTYDGHTLFVGPDGIVRLIDMDGSVVNTWANASQDYTYSGVEPLENGHILLFASRVGGSSPGSRIVAELDYNGNAVWDYEIPPQYPDVFFHHDSERLSNGNTLLTLRPAHTRPEHLADGAHRRLHHRGGPERERGVGLARLPALRRVRLRR